MVRRRALSGARHDRRRRFRRPLTEGAHVLAPRRPRRAEARDLQRHAAAAGRGRHRSGRRLVLVLKRAERCFYGVFLLLALRKITKITDKPKNSSNLVQTRTGGRLAGNGLQHRDYDIFTFSQPLLTGYMER